MSKLEVDAWSLIEVEMDEKLQTFTVKRRLNKEDLSLPGLKPTFIFYINGAQVIVNENGYFLLRWKKPKYFGGKIVVTQPLIPTGHVPKLKRLYSKMPLARLAKKSMKQLFFPGKAKIG
jgi:hypothetical protein